MTKGNKGITLIALVITIIVMLILVSVTISMAVNGGLFGYAQKAVVETQGAIDEEQKLAEGGVKIDGKWYNSIDEYLGKDGHNWSRTGDTFTCSHCSASYTMGDAVDYEDAGAASAEVTAARSGLDAYYAKNSKYPTDANADTEGKQTITAEEATWVVLGIEDGDGDGKNETLLITTQSPVGGYYMYGAAAYNYAPSYYDKEAKKTVEGDIDRICRELYSNSTYGTARGMKIEDVNAALNYTPAGGMYHDGSAYGTTGDFTTKLNSEKLATVFNSLKVNGTYTPDPNDNDSEADLGAYELNGYYYYLNDDATAVINDVDPTDESNTITAVEKKLIFGENKELVYVLASRGVGAHTDFARFGPGSVFGGYAYSYYYFFLSVVGVNNGVLVPVRPVVSLTSTLPNKATTSVE